MLTAYSSFSILSFINTLDHDWLLMCRWCLWRPVVSISYIFGAWTSSTIYKIIFAYINGWSMMQRPLTDNWSNMRCKLRTDEKFAFYNVYNVSPLFWNLHKESLMWNSPCTAPIFVYCQDLHTITWQPFIERATPILHIWGVLGSSLTWHMTFSRKNNYLKVIIAFDLISFFISETNQSVWFLSKITLKYKVKVELLCFSKYLFWLCYILN